MRILIPGFLALLFLSLAPNANAIQEAYETVLDNRNCKSASLNTFDVNDCKKKAESMRKSKYAYEVWPEKFSKVNLQFGETHIGLFSRTAYHCYVCD